MNDRTKQSPGAGEHRAPRLYTVGELTSILHFSEAKVRALIHSGALAAIRLGVEWRVKAEDLDEFLESRREVMTKARPT